MSGAATSAATSKFSAFMNHPAGMIVQNLLVKFMLLSTVEGPKTVFFWAPLMKWGLVAAGLKDLGRPADKLSVSQNLGVWMLIITLDELTSVVSSSSCRNWIHLGSVLIRNHPC